MCLLRNLKVVHAQGYVHGDIRGFNIVFSSAAACLCSSDSNRPCPRAALIDFDFSRQERTIYPVELEAVPDGVRFWRGAQPAHAVLEMRHDLFAVAGLMDLYSPESLENSAAWTRFAQEVRTNVEISAVDSFDIFPTQSMFDSNQGQGTGTPPKGKTPAIQQEEQEHQQQPHMVRDVSAFEQSILQQTRSATRAAARAAAES